MANPYADAGRSALAVINDHAIVPKDAGERHELFTALKILSELVSGYDIPAVDAA